MFSQSTELKMQDLNWILMLDVLSGAKFTNYGLNEIAQFNCGEVKSTKQYLKLSDALYRPTGGEIFDAS
jgi:hypothetical protein